MKLGNFCRIFLLALALSAYAAWSAGVRQPLPADLPTIDRAAADIPLLRLADAEALWEQRSTLFLDVRSAIDYGYGHITGAINVPEEELEQRLAALQPHLERARAVVVYCKSTDCGLSLWAALRLRRHGLAQTMIYPGGWNEWVNRGKPVTRLHER